MRLARFIGAAALFCGLALAAAGASAADHIESEVERVERELAKAEQSGHADPATDPLSVDPDLAVWSFVVFAVLLMVLWKFAWGPIVAGLEKREESIAHNIDDAKRQNEEARQLLVDYEARLTGATDEVRAILEAARRDAEQAKQTIIAQAKSAAEQERLRGLREIETATDAALQSLAERSAAIGGRAGGQDCPQQPERQRPCPTDPGSGGQVSHRVQPELTPNP